MKIPSCHICPRGCGVPRQEEEYSAGFCGMPGSAVAARAALHFGEEPCISGQNGSGTVFFSGCSLRCRFCQNAPISHDKFGRPISAFRLASIFRELVEAGAHNINLVNPTHFVPSILEALRLYRPPVPLVYNSSGYERLETLRLLDGVIDVYLPDLKYMDGALASSLSGAENYPLYATEAILEMARQTGPMVLDEDGIALRGTMVRHLVLPGYTHSSKEVLDWMAGHLPSGVWVSLMFQYTPVRELPEHPSLNRTLTRRECDKIWSYLVDKGLTDGYVQEPGSNGVQFIPAFDLTGI